MDPETQNEVPAAESGPADNFDPNDPTQQFRADPFELLKDFSPQEPEPDENIQQEVTPPAEVPPANAGEVQQPPAPVGNEQNGGPNLAQELAVMRAQLEQMQRMQAPAGQQPKPQQTQPAEEGPKAPNFLYQLPTELVQMVYSEDPAQQARGLSLLVAGAAQLAYREATQAMESRFDRYTPTVQEQIATQLRQYQVYSDFYGKYPELSAPQFRSVVQSTFAQMAQQGFQGWSADFRDKLATAVRARLGMPESSDAPQATTPKQPPRAFGNGQRQVGGGQPPAGTQERHIADVMDFF